MTDFLTDLSELRTRVSGPVLTVDDDGFAEESSGENLALLNTPDVVVGATSTEDVVESLRLARDLGLRVRVQSTGHGASAPITDGLLVSTRRLDTVSIDTDERVATVGAGARWRDVVAAAAPLGLAPITGSSPGVGVVGYLTGGGYGPLIRSHGVSSDHVRGFTVIDGRGEVLSVSADENADLFWALRGGKSGLGIVTEVRVELVELPELYAGSLMFEDEHIDRVLRGWLDYTRTAPDGVSTSLALMSFPPIDEIPEPMRGKRFASVRFAFPGPSAEGEKLAAPLRDLAPVFQDEIRPLAIVDIGLIHNDPQDPGPGWADGTLLARDAGSEGDGGLADALLAAVGPGAEVPFIAVELRHLRGSARTDQADDSAVGGRDATFSLLLIGVPDPGLFGGALPAAARGVFASLRPWLNPVSNVNWSAFGLAGTPNWSPVVAERLAAVRASHDPDHVFAP